MDRGYRRGLRLEPDRKSRGTWLGVLIGAWLLLAILAWFDPFGLGRHRFAPPLREPTVSLIQPRNGVVMPRGAGFSGDGHGARFAFGNVIDAPVRYGTENQLMRSSFATGGPLSLTEAMGMPDGAFIGEVGPAVRVVAVISGGYANLPDERISIIDLPEPADTTLRGPSEDRIVLTNGCLRLGTGAGPLLVLGPRANAVFIDDAGWLTVGSLSGMESLRVGETGIIATDALPAIPGIETAVHALRLQCGGNPDAVILDNVARTPVCDLTAEQAEANRAAMKANQREVTDRMAQARREQLAACVAQGKSELTCARTIPPMPPPPIDMQQMPFQGRAPGDMCLPQGEVPAGAWAPAPRPQPS